MSSKELDEELFKELEPLIRGMGFDLVELKSIKTKANARVFIVIYRREGLDLEACTDVLKTLRPRIQVLMENPDVSIEVSSPGTERNLKSPREYRIFQGRGVKVLINGANDWTGGILAAAGDRELELSKKDMAQTIAYDNIKKIKLDDGQEVD